MIGTVIHRETHRGEKPMAAVLRRVTPLMPPCPTTYKPVDPTLDTLIYPNAVGLA